MAKQPEVIWSKTGKKRCRESQGGSCLNQKKKKKGGRGLSPYSRCCGMGWDVMLAAPLKPRTVPRGKVLLAGTTVPWTPPGALASHRWPLLRNSQVSALTS